MGMLFIPDQLPACHLPMWDRLPHDQMIVKPHFNQPQRLPQPYSFFSVAR